LATFLGVAIFVFAAVFLISILESYIGLFLLVGDAPTRSACSLTRCDRNGACHTNTVVPVVEQLYGAARSIDRDLAPFLNQHSSRGASATQGLLNDASFLLSKMRGRNGKRVFPPYMW
jgi:hypothetical protein